MGTAGWLVSGRIGLGDKASCPTGQGEGRASLEAAEASKTSDLGSEWTDGESAGLAGDEVPVLSGVLSGLVLT